MFCASGHYPAKIPRGITEPRTRPKRGIFRPPATCHVHKNHRQPLSQVKKLAFHYRQEYFLAESRAPSSSLLSADTLLSAVAPAESIVPLQVIRLRIHHPSS